VGTPQGTVISPLLANIHLHYVFDLWANQWRQRHARGMYHRALSRRQQIAGDNRLKVAPAPDNSPTEW